jgi:hypothetical protein
MNLISIVGAFIITLSLLTYGIGSISLLRFKIISLVALIFLSAGIIFDITAIVLMVIGAKGTPFTFHGFVGYIAFLVMLIDTIWVWATYFKNGIDAPIGKNLHRYTKYAYLCWVAAYLTGSLIVLWR